MTGCRACGHPSLERVVDLGTVPAADFFPLAGTPVSAAESSHPLAMDLCPACGLAQLADDDTVPEEPRGIEPQALREQAAAAVSLVDRAGWLRGGTVTEFGSPHGGTWLPLLTERGFEPAPTGTAASLVLDSFGIMHEPDQRRAFATRAEALAPDGVLLLQFHTLTTIVTQGQWNAIRHGHFAYYSLTALRRLLADAGLCLADAWTFDLYGGTILIAAQRDQGTTPEPFARRLLAAERANGIDTARTLRKLQQEMDRQTTALRSWLQRMVAENLQVFAYGAASRAVALFARAHVDNTLIAAVADASPAKIGRRMPGTDVAIVPPDEMRSAKPDHILLTVPDLLPEVRALFPELDGRWVLPPDHRDGVQYAG
jgi:hypothetical protein